MNGKICIDKRIIIISAVLVVAILLVIVNTTVMNANVASNSRASVLEPTSVLNRKPTGSVSVTSAPLTRSVAVCLTPKASSVKDSTDLSLKQGISPDIFAKNRMVSIVGVKPDGSTLLLTLAPAPEAAGQRIAVLENNQFTKNESYRFVAAQKADNGTDDSQKPDNFEAVVVQNSKNCVSYRPSSN